MRALVVLLFALPLLAIPQEAHDTYGKTEAQILAMGHHKWNAFYASKEGDSTAAMAEGNEIFGEVAERRNDRISAKATPHTRAMVAKLRNLMTDFAGHACELGSNNTGGGTLWNPIDVDIQATSEMVLYGILGGEEAAAKPMTVSGVTGQLAILAKQIEKNHKDPDDQMYFKYGEAQAALKTMRVDFAKIVEIAKGLSRRDSDRVLGFCKDYAKLALGDWS